MEWVGWRGDFGCASCMMLPVSVDLLRQAVPHFAALLAIMMVLRAVLLRTSA